MPLKTEYQLHFGSDNYGVEKENYLSRLTFRKDRMSHEKRHTPLIWIDIDNKMDTTGNKTENAENPNETKIIESTDENSDKPPVSGNATEEEDSNVIASDQENQVVLSKDVGTQSPSKEDVRVEKRRSVLKPINRKKRIEHEKPIIAYGWADKESLQAKKTFNVRAPKTEVRISALRAANLRDVQKKKRLTGREKLRREKLKQQEVIDALTDFNQWETEYRRQFSPK